MDKINNELNVELDCCLVSVYRSGDSITRLHSDNEPIIDQNHSICNISIGAKRSIQFKDINTNDIVPCIELDHGSLLTMVEGTQQKLNHEVLPGDNTDTSVRYCLSFRKLVNKVPVNKFTNLKPEPVVGAASDDNLNKPTISHLIIGDSLTTWGITPGENTVTLTKGGARMRDMIPLLDKNVEKLDPVSYKDVQSVILCVGTNAINDLSVPLLECFSDYDKVVRELIGLFPNAKIGLFNIPPRFYRNVGILRCIVSFNNFLADLPNTYKQARSIHLYWEFITQKGYMDARWYSNDFLHFSDAGKLMVTN